MIGAPGAPPMGMTGAPVPPIGGGISPAAGPSFVRESTTGVPAGATSTPSGAPVVGAPGAAKPGLADTLKDKGFGAGLGQIASSLGGGKGKSQLDMQMTPASNFDPSAASRANAAKLFASILASRQRPGMPPPPGMLGG